MIIRAARLEDAAAIARVHVESWRSTYKGLVPDTYLAGLTCEAREPMWQRLLQNGSLIFVAADDDGRIFGFASGGPLRDQEFAYTGELYAIYLLAGDQRRGAGRGLMQAMMGALKAAGHTNMLVWVLAENPSLHFYEHMGGKRLGTKRIEIGGAPLEEVAYGWDHI